MHVVNALIEGVTQDIIAYLVEDRVIEVKKRGAFFTGRYHMKSC